SGLGGRAVLLLPSQVEGYPVLHDDLAGGADVDRLDPDRAALTVGDEADLRLAAQLAAQRQGVRRAAGGAVGVGVAHPRRRTVPVGPGVVGVGVVRLGVVRLGVGVLIGRGRGISLDPVRSLLHVQVPADDQVDAAGRERAVAEVGVVHDQGADPLALGVGGADRLGQSASLGVEADARLLAPAAQPAAA